MELAKIGYEYCLEAVEKRIPKVEVLKDASLRNQFVVEVYKVWQAKPKVQEMKATSLLEDAYKKCRKEQV